MCGHPGATTEHGAWPGEPWRRPRRCAGSKQPGGRSGAASRPSVRLPGQGAEGSPWKVLDRTEQGGDASLPPRPCEDLQWLGARRGPGEEAQRPALPMGKFGSKQGGAAESGPSLTLGGLVKFRPSARSLSAQMAPRRWDLPASLPRGVERCTQGSVQGTLVITAGPSQLEPATCRPTCRADRLPGPLQREGSQAPGAPHPGRRWSHSYIRSEPPARGPGPAGRPHRYPDTLQPSGATGLGSTSLSAVRRRSQDQQALLAQTGPVSSPLPVPGLARLSPLPLLAQAPSHFCRPCPSSLQHPEGAGHTGGRGRGCCGRCISKEALQGARRWAKGFPQMPSPNARPDRLGVRAGKPSGGVWRSLWAAPRCRGSESSQKVNKVTRAGWVGRGGRGAKQV